MRFERSYACILFRENVDNWGKNVLDTIENGEAHQNAQNNPKMYFPGKHAKLVVIVLLISLMKGMPNRIQ